MNCPKCGSLNSSVIDCRKTKDGKRRRRECSECGFRYTTIETLAERYKNTEGIYGKRKADDDAVEVVRCKDCIWFSKIGYEDENTNEENLNLHMGHCSMWRRSGVQGGCFCSYGERNDNTK